jgi:hypothetical protein
MGTLENFSIETENVVLLHFKDGQTKRVAVWQLSRHLLTRDLQRVRSALKLRRDFLRDHTPKSGLAIMLASGLMAVAWGSGTIMSNLMRPSAPVAAAPIKESTWSASALEVAPANTSVAPATAMTAGLAASTTAVPAAAAGDQAAVGTPGRDLQPTAKADLPVVALDAPQSAALAPASAPSPQSANSSLLSLNLKIGSK